MRVNGRLDNVGTTFIHAQQTQYAAHTLTKGVKVRRITAVATGLPQVSY